MKNRINSPLRTRKQPRRSAGATPTFTPVRRQRERHDGWTSDRQIAFIEALAECACVEEACAKVGVSRSSAYAFRAQTSNKSFRIAWEAALECGTRRLAEAMFSRALHGVTRPVFYQGEQIGERRYYDERLAMWLLRYRDPYRYGAWNDRERFDQVSTDGPFAVFTLALNNLAEDSTHAELGLPPVARKPFHTGPRRHDATDVFRALEAAEAWRQGAGDRRDRRDQARIERENADHERRMEALGREIEEEGAKKTGT